MVALVDMKSTFRWKLIWIIENPIYGFTFKALSQSLEFFLQNIYNLDAI